MSVSRFTAQPRAGTPVYTCRLCDKRTRETGEGESGVQLCARCFAICGEENAMADNAPGTPEHEKAKARLQALGAL
jgi:hypothetical protein